MKITHGAFLLGKEYRRRTPDEPRFDDWKYTVTAGVVTIYFAKPICKTFLNLIDGDGNVWGCIRPHSISVYAPYSWDGSSKSPDYDGVMLASLIHDVLYQWSGCEGFPLSRWTCDKIFYTLAQRPNLALFFVPACYWAGLIVGGRIVGGFGTKHPGLRIA